MARMLRRIYGLRGDTRDTDWTLAFHQYTAAGGRLIGKRPRSWSSSAGAAPALGDQDDSAPPWVAAAPESLALVEAEMLGGCLRLCVRMCGINPQHLLWTTDHLAEVKVIRAQRIRTNSIGAAGRDQTIQRIA